jgi:hypothetical protein
VTTTEDVTRPVTADQHAAEARRLASLVRPTALEDHELVEFLAYDGAASVLAAAQMHATLALVEEQRTANLIALFREEGPEVFRAEHTGLPGTAGRAAVEASIRLMYLEVADEVASRVGLA